MRRWRIFSLDSRRKRSRFTPYQPDARINGIRSKKSLLVESVLNRLTVPAFYFAPNEADSQVSDVVDGQQRLTTLRAYFNNEFALSDSEDCPYYTKQLTLRYEEILNSSADVWQKTFRRYNLTLVILPSTVDLSLRLEIFRRINEGGTPLSGQDIRLSYYSESECVRFIQAVGIFDSSRDGAKRMIKSLECPWPWQRFPERESSWKEWWEDSKTAIGQTPSEMFLWHLIGRYRDKVDDILADQRALAILKIRFRGNTQDALDIVCAQFKQEDLDPEKPRLFPNLEELQMLAFPEFARWWYDIRMACGPSASIAKHRSIALLIPSLEKVFGTTTPSDTQWNVISLFLKATRETAKKVLGVVDFPESRKASGLPNASNWKPTTRSRVRS